jgi:putative endonuclease
MVNHKQALGQAGEDFSAWLLGGLGYRIVERNWRSRYGEIDIIARTPDGALCFIEVRTRSTDTVGTAFESLSPRKRARIARRTLFYLAERSTNGPVRIDFMAHQLDESGCWRTIHLQNAFGWGGR